MEFYKDNQLTIHNGDALKILKTFKDESVNCVITSPPYWSLRDYNVDGQLGLEKTFEEYISKLCDIFDEVKRVLKKDGTCWVVIGDTYSGTKTGNTEINKNKKVVSNSFKKPKTHLQDKSLCQIPSRFAIEMTNRGWILRNEIVWYKPNCMSASVKDRFTVDFEKIFFFTKNKKYCFEQQFEPQQEESHARILRGVSDHHKNLNVPGQTTHSMHKKRAKGEGEPLYNPLGRNKRCVWQITTKGYSEAHFAVYPEKLCVTPTNAGCPEGGTVLDPFMGSGTTCLVANKLNRKAIGIELNQSYCKMALKRCNQKVMEL